MLCDFGFPCWGPHPLEHKVLVGTQGTPLYMPPECMPVDPLSSDSESEESVSVPSPGDDCERNSDACPEDAIWTRGVKVDVWALGVVFYELATLEMPFGFQDKQTSKNGGNDVTGNSATKRPTESRENAIFMETRRSVLFFGNMPRYINPIHPIYSRIIYVVEPIGGGGFL